MFEKIASRIANIQGYKITGVVTAVKGLMVKCVGITSFVSVGSQCKLYTRTQQKAYAEVIAVNGDEVLLMSFKYLSNIGVGCKVEIVAKSNVVFPDKSWLGRVIDSMALPIDNKGELFYGKKRYNLSSSPPAAYERRLIYDKLDTGVKAINVFTPCCYGQRMGIFAGSGVGKSILLSMISKFSSVEVKVICLVGERGREVQQFLQEYLGEEGLKNAILIVATSDESALMRKRAALLAITISEYFRDQGREVLCLIDSITRFAMAQREIGLCIGEVQTTKGYTPTVFSEMSRLLERAGSGVGEQGNITGLFTILVEGDDNNEPIVDAIRSIVDGHIILDREIADRGRFPAINVLKSISRLVPQCNSENENKLVNKARMLLSFYYEMEDMIKLGAYQKSSNKEIDQAMHYYPLLEEFFAQKINEKVSINESYEKLKFIFCNN